MNSLEFAINMELDGEKYYREQAEINKENGLNKAFLLLAEEEEKHAIILQNKSIELDYELKDNKALAQAKSIFKGISDYKEETIAMPKQLDLYRMALDMEKKSIDLYNEFLSEATDEKDKELFSFLVKQEEEHFKILEELVLRINRPEEWVESAEFGIREEY
jgi:rubrerythrin